MKILSFLGDVLRAFLAQPEAPMVDSFDPTDPAGWADSALMAEVFGDDDLSF
jgi:hypothetical protein